MKSGICFEIRDAPRIQKFKNWKTLVSMNHKAYMIRMNMSYCKTILTTKFKHQSVPSPIWPPDTLDEMSWDFSRDKNQFEWPWLKA